MFRLSLGIAFFIGISTPTGLWAVTDYRLSIIDYRLPVWPSAPRWPISTESKALFGQPEFDLNFGRRSLTVKQRATGVSLPGTLTSIRRVLPATTGRYRPRPIGAGPSAFWVVVGQGLYFFHSEQTRAAFLANPGRIIDTAERKWADIVRGLGS